MEVDYNSGNVTKTSINILHVARGDGYFDDVKLCELLPVDGPAGDIVGLAKRGEDIFHNHVARCVLCHTLKGQGSTVGPALDGIATRATPEYINESLLEPSKVIAKGFEGGGELSPMPPMARHLQPAGVGGHPGFPKNTEVVCAADDPELAGNVVAPQPAACVCFAGRNGVSFLRCPGN